MRSIFAALLVVLVVGCADNSEQAQETQVPTTFPEENESKPSVKPKPLVAHPYLPESLLKGHKQEIPSLSRAAVAVKAVLQASADKDVESFVKACFALHEIVNSEAEAAEACHELVRAKKLTEKELPDHALLKLWLMEPNEPDHRREIHLLGGDTYTQCARIVERR